LLRDLPAATKMPGPFYGLQANHCQAVDKGYHSDAYRAVLIVRGITPHIHVSHPNRRNHYLLDQSMSPDPGFLLMMKPR